MASDTKPTHEHPHPIYDGEEISLRDLARALWRYRWVVVVFGILGGLGGLAISYQSTKFVSEGLFLTPDMKLGDFKKYETALINEPRLEEFLQLAKLGDKPVATQMRKLVTTPGAMSLAARPTFTLTGRDARAYDIPTGEDSGEMVGIRLSMKRAEPVGMAPVMFLAEYVRSTIIKVNLKETLLTQCLAFRARSLELRNEQIQSEFAVRQARTKVARLRELIKENPSTVNIESRQVVSVENGGDRYLSPAAQLVATEVAIADLVAADVQRERARISAALKRDFYCAVRAAQERPLTGQALLTALDTIRKEVFEGQDMANDIVEQTANELDIQHQGWHDLYLERMRFVASPDGAEVRVRDPSLRVALMLGGILGGLVGILFALLLAWWHDNRDLVLARDDSRP